LNLLQNEKKQEVLNRVLAYDEIIGDSSKLQQKWSSFVVSMDNEYLNLWSPLSYISNRYVSGLFRRLNLKGLNKKGLALMLNLMRCEAHADVSKEVIKRYLLK
jgi:poly-gamma-glutamate synthesis protein (capsule biosynthesis protein)